MSDPAVHIKDVLSPQVVIEKSTLGPLISSIMHACSPSKRSTAFCVYFQVLR